LRALAKAVEDGVRSRSGLSCEVNTIAVCDGIAMNHAGMRYSLPSRELIADSVEVLAGASYDDVQTDTLAQHGEFWLALYYNGIS